MAPSPTSDTGVVAAFRAEAAALTAVCAGRTGADLARPSPCPPWTVAGLLGHLVIAAGRVDQAIAAASDQATGAGGPLVPARGYYRPDARFSPAVNADRIEVAAALAARLGSPAAIHAELTGACERSLQAMASAAAGQKVRTRHGDRMLLAEFTVTRVVELAIHGLDLAAGLDRPPWLTPAAAGVLETLLLPDTGATARLRTSLGCDRIGVIAKLTGRAPMTADDHAALAQLGISPLALG
jgi:uncharacterized protein (TIGR03083 family)